MNKIFKAFYIIFLFIIGGIIIKASSKGMINKNFFWLGAFIGHAPFWIFGVWLLELKNKNLANKGERMKPITFIITGAWFIAAGVWGSLNFKDFIDIFLSCLCFVIGSVITSFGIKFALIRKGWFKNHVHNAGPRKGAM